MNARSFLTSIHHDGSGRYVRTSDGGEPKIGQDITLRLRTAVDAPVEHVLLRTSPDGEQQFIPMYTEVRQEGSKEACRWFTAMLRLEMPVTTYRFLIFTRQGAYWYNASGLHRHLITDAEDFRLLADYAAPTWVRDSVFYQIFPDRFADGDPDCSVHTGEFVYRGQKALAGKWGTMPLAGGPAAMAEFFGGDLIGIEQHLDYLQDLGVNALYLNPIFTAYSNHRYDVTDYYQVDRHLGGDSALASLRDRTRRLGMHLILDIVPNHCGELHPWFQAALANPQASTAEYFTFHHHPDDYACWLGVRSLPKLNYRSPNLRKVMYADPDAIFRHWLKPPYAIDGWRLDVANMLARQGGDQFGNEVGREIRQAVKQENPQAYLLGENFFDGSLQLQGDMWDAIMNYAGFSKPLWYWLQRFQVSQHGKTQGWTDGQPWPTQSLVASWQAFRAAIPWVIARQQFNLLSSHDTLRILSLVEEQPGLNRVAVGLLMTYPGVPSVYYGDEVGLSGGKEATRACMNWDRQTWDEDLRNFYQKLIHFRRRSPALIDGGFQILLVEENTLAFLRDCDEQQIVVVAHRGTEPRPSSPLDVAQGAITDGTQFEELSSGRLGTVAAGVLDLGPIPTGIEIWCTLRE